MQITIKSKFAPRGEWWGIETTHDIPDDLSSDGKMKRIAAIIDGLETAGLRPERPQAISPVRQQEATLDPSPNVTGCKSPEFTWPPPHCGLHSTPLKISTVQTADGGTAYYCPKRVGDGYCKHRATVDQKSGLPKFYEVN